MKKFLLILLLLYSAISYAEKSDNKFYLKLNIAANKVTSFKQYSHISPEINAGFGYYLDDFCRIDIVGGNSIFSFDDKYMTYNEVVGESATSGTKSVNYKAQTQYLMLNNYLNIISNDKFQIYVSGGVGIGKIKEKITHFFSGLLINGDIISIPLTTEHYESKGTKNFIYSLGIGTSIKINSRVNLDLAYNYKDFGKPKYKIEDIPNIPPIKRYKGHNFSIGIRFDL